MANKKLKVAVLGAGKIGYAHIDGYLAHSRAEVVALVDKSEERLTAAADKYDIKYRFTDYKEVLNMKEIDIVSIGLPNFLHCETAVAALKAGKHVLCDKPMAMNYAEAKKMMDAAKRSKRLFMVGQNFRFREDTQIIKQFIDRGELGEIYHARAFMLRKSAIPKMGTWFTLRRFSGGGSLIDIGVHILDLALHLMGTFDAEAVSGQIYDKFGPRDIGRGSWGMSDVEPGKVHFDVDDYSASLIKLKGGRTVMLETSWHAYQEPTTNLTLLGTEGGARLVPLQIQRRVGDKCEIIDKIERSGPLPLPENRMVHFMDCILDSRIEPVAKVEQSVKLQKILDAILQSSRTGKEVRIKN